MNEFGKNTHMHEQYCVFISFWKKYWAKLLNKFIDRIHIQVWNRLIKDYFCCSLYRTARSQSATFVTIVVKIICATTSARFKNLSIIWPLQPQLRRQQLQGQQLQHRQQQQQQHRQQQHRQLQHRQQQLLLQQLQLLLQQLQPHKVLRCCVVCVFQVFFYHIVLNLSGFIASVSDGCVRSTTVNCPVRKQENAFNFFWLHGHFF